VLLKAMSTICSTCCWIKWCTTKLHMNSCQQTSACLLVSAQTLSIQTGRRQSRVWRAGSVQHDRLHIRSRSLNNHTWLMHISIFEATILLEAIFYMNSYDFDLISDHRRRERCSSDHWRFSLNPAQHDILPHRQSQLSDLAIRKNL